MNTNSQESDVYQNVNKCKNSSLVAVKLTNNRRRSAEVACYGGHNTIANTNCSKKIPLNLPNPVKIINDQENIGVITSKGRYSPHPNEIFIHPTKLSIPPMNNREDPIVCYLPPPSPAPNSDRFVTEKTQLNHGNILDIENTNSNNTHRHHLNHDSIRDISASASLTSLSNSSCSGVKQISTPLNVLTKQNNFNSTIEKKCSYSPSSRIKSNKDFMSPCNEYTEDINVFNKNAAKFPQFSTPLITNDTYTFLCSRVHTPVKRYIPTPPPTNEMYSNIPTQQMVQKIHMKCCSESLRQQNNAHIKYTLESPVPFNELFASHDGAQKLQMSESLRNKHLDSVEPNIYTAQTIKQDDDLANKYTAAEGIAAENNSSNTLSYISSYIISHNTNESPLEEYNHGNYVEDCQISNVQTLNHSYKNDPNSNLTLNNIIDNGSIEYNAAATCLHCNNVRRKTGVHRTTQTTGPISPTPLAQPITSVGNFYSSKNNENIKNSPPIITEKNSNNLSMDEIENQNIFLRAEKGTPLQHNNIIRTNRGNNATGSGTCHQTLSQNRISRKKRLIHFINSKISGFFGLEIFSEFEDYILWQGRQKRFAIRRFGSLNHDEDIQNNFFGTDGATSQIYQASGRPDILPDNDSKEIFLRRSETLDVQLQSQMSSQVYENVERKPSVLSMLASLIPNLLDILNSQRARGFVQWSRSFAPLYVTENNFTKPQENFQDYSEIIRNMKLEVFFDSPATENSEIVNGPPEIEPTANYNQIDTQTQRPNYLATRLQGWQTSNLVKRMQNKIELGQQNPHESPSEQDTSNRGKRILPQLLDGVLENSRRPTSHKIKLFTTNDLDDRSDFRPIFTYWINTIQIIVLLLSIICYGIGPVGIGFDQKTGQVLVTSLSLQTVQHIEQQNLWVGPRNTDLVHIGAKFATCMRADDKIVGVLLKTRRQERDTACCIRNDDSGCVQSSQADCSVRGLFPTKSISTWKKWGPGESGPGGRISGSVCGLDPKFCDAPASIAPYEWPDDITKWPICRKTNSASPRFRYKDHTAEHMICEVIGHPCCTGVFGECRITTREYCEFINGYFHEEASLCSQISCINNVCGMIPFISAETPDQIYRLVTSLCIHAGIVHLAITVIFQHIILSDLERLMGSIRTGIVYICSGIAGNLTSAVLAPYKAEVGPSASLCGVLGSCLVLLFLCHWKNVQKPHLALLKILIIGAFLFALGALPWQINIVSLFVGIISGSFLTISLVPFLSVGKYDRKAKINSIWTCICCHFIVFSTLLTIFYMFPTEIKNFTIGDAFGYYLDPNGAIGNRQTSHVTTITNYDQSEKYKFQHIERQKIYHHHHSDDIISNSATAVKI